MSPRYGPSYKLQARSLMRARAKGKAKDRIGVCQFARENVWMVYKLVSKDEYSKSSSAEQEDSRRCSI